MKLCKIESPQRYLDIVGRYARRGCVSNDYIQRDVERMIERGDLFESCSDRNAFLLVRKAKCYRVYYYVNDFDELHDFNGEELVTEILYHGEAFFPQQEIGYLERNGFVKNLVRDQYGAMYKDLAIGNVIGGVMIDKAQNIDDVKKACMLFNASFDEYSGDYIPENNCQALLEHGDVIIAKDISGTFLGALHQTVENRVAWVSHLAVVQDARGKGVGKALLDHFIESNQMDDRSRYMLWVQHLNEPAVKMYQKTGFKYMNKSTFSMIRHKN